MSQFVAYSGNVCILTISWGGCDQGNSQPASIKLCPYFFWRSPLHQSLPRPSRLRPSVLREQAMSHCEHATLKVTWDGADQDRQSTQHSWRPKPRRARHDQRSKRARCSTDKSAKDGFSVTRVVLSHKVSSKQHLNIFPSFFFFFHARNTVDYIYIIAIMATSSSSSP